MFTPRERMRRFLNGQPVDRIPNGLGGCETAGLHMLAQVLALCREAEGRQPQPMQFAVARP